MRMSACLLHFIKLIDKKYGRTEVPELRQCHERVYLPALGTTNKK